MFERFTDGARQAVVRAQEEARRLGHSYIGCEHLLLAAAAGRRASRRGPARPRGHTRARGGGDPAHHRARARRGAGRPAAGRGPRGAGRHRDRPGRGPRPDRGRVRARCPDPRRRVRAGEPASLPGARPGARARWPRCGKPGGPAAPGAAGAPGRRPSRPPRCSRAGIAISRSRRGPRRCLELSLRQALAQHDNYIGLQHLVLALLTPKDGMPGMILAGLGASPDALRAAILDRYRKAS